MKRYDVVIGIDPDVDKSGICALNVKTKKCSINSLSFPMLIDKIVYINKSLQNAGATAIVVVEAGWLNHKSCFHLANGRGGERIAKNVGANHQVGKSLTSMLQHHGIPYVEQKPLSKKLWHGEKITHAQLSKFVSDLPNRTNQEERDAVLLAWHYAGFNIKL